MVEFDLRHFGSKKLLLSPVSVSVWISIVSSSVSIVSVWSESVSVVSIVSISISLSISFWLSISIPLAIVSVSVWVSISIGSVSVWSKSVSIVSIVGISISLSFWLSISISLSVVSVPVWVSISIGSVSVWSQAISVVSIPSISIWFSISRPLTIVSIWKTIVGVGMGVDMGSIGVGEWSIMSISVSVVSAVQQPWVSLGVSFGISLSSWLSLSLGNRLNSLGLSSSWGSNRSNTSY